MKKYSNRSLRVVALQCAGLNSPPPQNKPTLQDVKNIVESIGALQIDTLHVVQRSHYLTIWSRLGNFDTNFIDQLTGDPKHRAFFEGWYHCACFIPLNQYRYEMLRQHELRGDGHHWYSQWSSDPENQRIMQNVLQKVRDTGEIKVSSLEGKGTPFATWWNWRPEKMALEHLWTFGDLMISRRENFRKVYDLTERVLPKWVDTTLPTPKERDEHRILEGMKRFGIAASNMAGDFSHAARGKVSPLVRQMIADGRLIEILGETTKGERTLLAHPEALPLLENAENGSLQADRTTFLNPFDNLWWATGRDELIWGFRQRLEAYVPAPKRVWGYYCMPILLNGNFVGRFDPKMDRKNKKMIIQNLVLENAIRLRKDEIAQIAEAFRSFLSFHKADEIVFEKCNTPGLIDDLKGAIEMIPA